jgi:ABC-type nickel/cobalt efflux system permease component RcnA
MIEALRAEAFALWLWLAGLQRDILAETATRLRVFAETGDWALLAAFAPWAILFGAAHALTPGHSKTVLALWTAGTAQRRGEALRTAITLSATHVGLSVLIVLAALPVVTMARGEAGRAPLLEDISRVLLALAGLWLIGLGLCGAAHDHRGRWFGVAAGLTPCPLTLFVMTFAAARGVTVAGLGFAAMTLIGVAVVLGSIALAAASFGHGLRRLARSGDLLARGLMVATGTALCLTAAFALAR